MRAIETTIDTTGRCRLPGSALYGFQHRLVEMVKKVITEPRVSACFEPDDGRCLGDAWTSERLDLCQEVRTRSVMLAPSAKDGSARMPLAPTQAKPLGIDADRDCRTGCHQIGSRSISTYRSESGNQTCLFAGTRVSRMRRANVSTRATSLIARPTQRTPW